MIYSICIFGAGMAARAPPAAFEKRGKGRLTSIVRNFIIIMNIMSFPRMQKRPRGWKQVILGPLPA